MAPRTRITMMGGGWGLVFVLLSVGILHAAVDFDARLRPLLPESTWTPSGQTLAPPITLASHEASLRADKDHGNAFFVKEAVGSADTRRVIFIIPQFHRSPLLPITWSSLGEVISLVQGNIDFVLTRLVRAHGVRCLGTEGSWLPRLRRSAELDQLAGWHHALHSLKQQSARLNPDAGSEHHMHDVIRLLTPYLKRYALMLDGVGIALARLQLDPATRDINVHRFGIEDEKLNTRALELLARMRTIEEELALLEPQVEDDAEDALAALWRDEFPTFKSEVATPLQDALTGLARTRTALRKDGMDLDAEAIGRFSSVATTAVEEVLKLESALEYEAYYETLRQKKSQARPDAGPAPRPPTAAQRRKIRRLRKELDALNTRYERTAGRDREDAAMRKVLARMGTSDVGRCVVVMGANHVPGLLRALKQHKGKPTAAIVVAPYEFPEE